MAMFTHDLSSDSNLFVASFSTLMLSLLLSSSVLADQTNSAKGGDAKAVTSAVKEATVATTLDMVPIPRLFRGKSREDSFKEADKNNDEKVSFEELMDYKALQKRERAKKEAERLMQGCDKNKDGMVTLSELPDEEDMQFRLEGLDHDEINNIDKIMASRCMFPKEILEIMDFNEDGSLTLEEITQGVSSDRPPNRKIEKKMEKKMLSRAAKRREKEFTKCDKNSDGILTLREAVSMRCSLHLFTEQFDAYDTNTDSFLTIDEVSQEIKQVEFEPPEDPELIERRRKMPPLERLQSAFYDCDKNKDGRLDKSETIGASCEQDMVYFDTVDNDLDGSITEKELQRMRSKKEFDRVDKNKDGMLDSKEYKRSRIY